MSSACSPELESSLEQEFQELGEGEFEDAAEGEGILGALSGLGTGRPGGIATCPAATGPGTAILTRILRARPQTRPAVRVAPTIARRTLRSLKRYAAAGVPITRRKAGGTVAREMQQVLGSPVAVASSIANNVRAAGLLRAGA